MSIELCFFRHGRTIWNAAGKYQGIADVDLDELGQRQGKVVADRCREMAPAAIYTSDLRRCADVAAMASEATGVPVVKDLHLRERDVGEWSGLTRQEVSSRFPDDFEAWMNGDELLRPGGGESVAEVEERIEAFIQGVVDSAVTGTVVAFSHAGLIRTVVQRVMGPGTGRANLGVPSQGSLTVFRIADDGKRKLEAFNDRGHLLSVEDIDREAPAPAIY